MTAPSKAGVVVQDTFKTQLMQLTDKLGAAKAHYIRCIKPNSKKVKPVGVLDLKRRSHCTTAHCATAAVVRPTRTAAVCCC